MLAKPKIALFVHQPACSVDSANGIILSLQEHYNFKLFSRDEVEPTFFNDVNIVAVPGGIGDADRFESLMKYNCQHVRKFVKAGGKYLGICMGAYWAGPNYFNILDHIKPVQYIKRFLSSLKSCNCSLIIGKLSRKFSTSGVIAPSK